mmetsp:Transcript_10443/g.14433  ORF Transcript_10443/g.14433 Transcript_10443/m.14433 type:complete len:182 (-) Transcript_10443:209-754(-)
MEPTPTYYHAEMYLNTQKGNKISKQVLIRGTDHIMIDGKAVMQSNAILRGDLSTIRMGYYVILREDVVLRPSYSKVKGKLRYQNLKIGDYVYIDKGTIVSAQEIGSNVHIGKNCIIGHRAVLKDNCKILDNSVLAPDTVVPPFTVYGGHPATYIGELPESISIVNKDLAKNYYRNFQAIAN